MECVKCLGDTKVVYSVKDKGTVYRERVCKECGFKFYTKEEICDSFEAMESIRYVKAMYKRIERERNAE